jgi:8-amino-3,8-dideoxy-alpha-D-manno-octulosonate transaminase
MTELSAAVLLAQLRRLDHIRARLRANKSLFKSLIADLPGLRFCDLPDPDGDLATHLVVLFPTGEVARKVTARTAQPRAGPTRACTSTAVWSTSFSSGRPA